MTLTDAELTLLRAVASTARQNEANPDCQSCVIRNDGNASVVNGLAKRGLVEVETKVDGQSGGVWYVVGLTQEGHRELAESEADERFAGLTAILRRPDFYPDTAIRELARIAREQDVRLSRLELREAHP